MQLWSSVTGFLTSKNWIRELCNYIFASENWIRELCNYIFASERIRGLHGLKTEARTRPVPEIVWPNPTRPERHG